jgi:phosphoglycerate dehydrogenase-like enzyme
MWTWSIGKEIARTAKSFGMKTIWLRTKNESVEYFDEIYTFDKIKTFLSDADYVVWVLPNTKDTQDIINERTLSYMKNTAVYINVWRWSNVNEDDIINALNNKTIAYAVLDVFKTEPLPKDSPLWNIENLIITPHISGYIESTQRMLEIFETNYNKFISWEELDYQIDFKKWY